MKERYGQLPLPKMTPYLLSLIKTGDVYDLGTVRCNDMPLWSGHPAFRVLPYKWHGDTDDVAPPGTLLNDIVITTMHAGTHVDALNHIGEIRGDKIILGKDVDASTTREWWGCNWMDGSKFHPIILRAVILDMLEYLGGEDTGGEITLPRKYAITADDIKGCMEASNIELKPDEPTAFLIRTGMIKYFNKKMDNYGGDAAGPNVDTEKYLVSIGAVLTGSDTVSYEQMLVGDHPVHRWMMQNGILMNEVLDLEEVCEAKVTEGVYVALPLKMKGTSGSLIDPIVIT
ncbi:MAG: cyclase family protein [Firmicutes bacterium]|nr:cyclase family protein [Bacillota bacterium]